MLSGDSFRQTVHTHSASVHQTPKLVAALLRVARVTAGLVESNGSLPPGLWITSPTGWLPRTGISSGTLGSAIEYGLPFTFTLRTEKGRSYVRCALLRCAGKMLLVFLLAKHSNVQCSVCVNATTEIHRVTIFRAATHRAAQWMCERPLTLDGVYEVRAQLASRGERVAWTRAGRSGTLGLV